MTSKTSLLIAASLAFLSPSTPVVYAQGQYQPPPPPALEATNSTTSSQQSAPPNGTDITQITQLQNATNSTAPNPNLVISCSGQIYGFNVNADSCIDALEQIHLTDRTAHTFGRRNGRDHYDYNTPQRFISIDGLCLVDVNLRWGANAAYCSEQLIGRAGVALLEHCVGEGREQPSTGGVAYNIGGDNQLNVFLAKSYPTAICYGALNPILQLSCKDIVDMMDLSAVEQVFGPISDPDVDVELPYLLVSRDRKCTMTITTIGLSDVASWWDFWEAAVQLSEICVRSGKNGKNPAIGEKRRLCIEVTTSRDGLSDS